MLTQCPACATNFRVTSTQLKARAGNVRCGQCHYVFNAIDTLADDSAIAVAKKESTPNAGPEYLDLEVNPHDFGLGQANTDTELSLDGSQQNAKPAPDVAPTEPASTLADENVELTDYLADEFLPANVTPSRRWPWIAGSAFAVLLLLAQAVYFYRVEIAVLRPDVTPWRQVACKSLRCEVPRPRHIETLGIDASDLRPDPQQPGRLQLIATLRSKAIFAQEWPTLELALTDVADRKLAIKHFAAGDYLAKGSDLTTGFPANGEIAVNLPLDVGDLPAAGYRLYIFYP